MITSIYFVMYIILIISRNSELTLNVNLLICKISSQQKYSNHISQTMGEDMFRLLSSQNERPLFRFIAIVS